MSTSVLTFNASVSDKTLLSRITSPFQIMPSTRTNLTDRQIASYNGISNDSILIHVNYITRVFRHVAIEKGSLARRSLKQYVQLAKRIGTTHILVHLPSTVDEYNEAEFGFSVLDHELANEGFTIHLEVPSWSKDLTKLLQQNMSDAKPVEVMMRYIDDMLGYVSVIGDESYRLVIDTAHLHANGCDADAIVEIIEKYRDRMQFMHLNGNMRPMWTSDTHVPMFSGANRMIGWERVSECCAKAGVVCVAEVTKNGASWNEWEEYAKRFGFELVKESDAFAT